MSAVAHEPESCLARFGLPSFRPGQRDVVQAVLDGRDCLCIMPTGGGKSLCFQLPAIMRPGVVLVISPLIALMKDQVDSLQRLGLRATFINSSLDSAEQAERLEGVLAGTYDLLYVAPERLRAARFLDAMKRTTVQLLAIDEAHCISEWGHDFRPDYARIGRFREKLDWPQTIALTATATPDVRKDVVDQLRLRDPAVFITGFARPNLRFECDEPNGTSEKKEQLVELLERTPGAALVYASTRKRCEELVEFLGEHLDRRVGVYHAGLLPEDRRQVQDDFMSGRTPVIVATNAFGMGIDKRDLRLVVHFNLPGTLEAYYQEAGRAGRDGLPARCVLLLSYADRYIQEFFIENKYPAREVVKQVWDFLRQRPENPIELTLQQIKESLDLSITAEGVGTCEQLLEKCGAIERLDSQQNQAAIKLDSSLPTLVDMLPREAKVQRRVLRALEEIVDDQRSSWVTFPLATLAAELEMDRDSLQRAIRELLRLEAVEYSPPFRGRALRVLTRDMRFEKLAIDFDAMARRKAADMEKLESVIRYAQARRCRQLEILEYFGDPQRKPCGSCDNCRPELGTTNSAIPSVHATEDAVVEAVRMVLSGAARAKQRIGKELLALMLTGSTASRLTKLRLNELSTYGLLSELRQVDVSELIDAIIEARLLAYIDLDKFRAVLHLTELGQAVMRGATALPERFTLSAPLLQKLRARRRHPSTRRSTSGSGSPAANTQVPVATIPSPPMSPPAANRQPVHGDRIGGTANVLSALPASIQGVPEAQGDETQPGAAEVGGPEAREAEAGDAEASAANESLLATSRPDHYWTWRLLADGYPVDVCLAMRRIDRATLTCHLAAAGADGLVVDPHWLD